MIKNIYNYFKKYNNLDFTFFNNLNLLKEKKIVLTRKNCILTKEYINKDLNVYNGRDIKKINITNNCIYLPLGQFLLTKRKTTQIHKKNKKETKKKK
jgi:ribosomal protein S19